MGFLFVLLCLVTAVVAPSAAQDRVPGLERVITISFTNERIDESLRMIGAAAKVTFSYKSSLLDKDRRITYGFRNATVREVLDQIFNGSIEYKERGRYIILVKSQKVSSKDSKVLSGYVVDEATGKRLENVSVYDPVSLESAVTDSYGYFSLEIRNPTSEEIRLAINKRQYTDTLVVVPRSNRRLLNIPIRVDTDKLGVFADSVSQKLRRFWLATRTATEQAVNMENISDTIYRSYQFSLLPFIGTNGKLSGNVINDYSLNVWGGYSLGNRKAEFAGLFNATRGNVNGFQSAGLVNGVVGEQRGVQLAGLANGTLGEANGVQLAGLANLNASSGKGVRGAGLINLSLEGSSATQLAGLANVVLGDQRRTQAAGLFNVVTDDAGPAQIAGLFNFCGGSFSGAQVAGSINVAAKDVDGVQFSGLLNIAPKNMRGVQVGLINFARWADGAQIGFINVSSQMKGLPFGFLSFVGKGYHKLEISADEVFYTNIAFRTGVRQFYNILTVGAQPQSFEREKTLWSFGYGVGTAPKLARWLYLNFDLTSSQIVDGNSIEKINLLNKLYAGFDFQITKGFSFTAGATFNGQVTDVNYELYPEIFSHYTPGIVENRNFGNDLNLKAWWGAKAGFRFF